MSRRSNIKKQGAWLWALLMLVPALGWAQTGDDEEDLPGQNITVISTIRPILADAEKVSLSPTLPPIESETPELKYDLPVRPLKVPYVAPDVRPLAMKADEVDPLPNVYAKVGFGNYTTPYLDLYLNSGRSNRFENRDNNTNLGLHVGYISSKSSRAEQQYSDFTVSGHGTFFTDAAAIKVSGGYDRNAVRFWGYDEETDSLLAAMDNKQHFNHIYGAFEVRNAKKTDYNIDYDGKLDIHFFNDRLGQREINPIGSFMLSKRFDNDNQLRGTISLDYTSFSNDSTKRNRAILSLLPSYRLLQDIWFVDLGINTGADEGGFYIYPDVYFERELAKQYVIFYANLAGKSVKNNLRTLVDDNPFLEYNVMQRNSREFGVKAGIRGVPFQNFSYNISAAYTNVRHLPLFVNDTTFPNRFEVVYDTNATVLDLHLEAGYSFSEKVRALFSTDFYSYTLQDEIKPWHLPTVKLGFGLAWQVTKRLDTRADVYFFNNVFARETDGTAISLPGTVDINFEAAYRINDSFYIFANVFNIASTKHQRYYRYPSYGLNAIVGLKMIF